MLRCGRRCAVHCVADCVGGVAGASAEGAWQRAAQLAATRTAWVFRETVTNDPRGGAAATPKALEGRVEASRCRRQRGVRRGPDWAAGCQMMEKLVSVAISR